MKSNTDIQELFETGAHFGYSRSRRHPSAASFIFATKDKNDIFNLEETQRRLNEAGEFIMNIAESGKKALFVAGKHEATKIIRESAEKSDIPFVAGRWIGGTLTNFKEIRKRIDRLEKLIKERDSGERDKYTKLEKLMLDREIDELEGRFGGLKNMKELPAALFIIDPKHEEIAVSEANQLGIPVVALASSDCNFDILQYPIPANDSSIKSINFFTYFISQLYEKNRKVITKPVK
jgi:small subunit ribosomal protein S2